MKWILLYSAILNTVCCACSHDNFATSYEAQLNGDFFTGTWIYRSLLNDTTVNRSFDSLEFAAATMQLKNFTTDSLSGVLYWEQQPLRGLNIKGKYFQQDSTTCFYLAGLGDSTLGTPGWQYNYQGFIVPNWKEGVNQATVMVGSVVRVKKHSCNALGDSCHPAGLVASMYLVKK